jgi:hypothetical protein
MSRIAFLETGENGLVKPFFVNLLGALIGVWSGPGASPSLHSTVYPRPDPEDLFFQVYRRWVKLQSVLTPQMDAQ